MIESSSVVAWGREEDRRAESQKAQGHVGSGDTGCVHCLRCGDEFPGGYKCQNLANRTLHMCAVYCMSLTVP